MSHRLFVAAALVLTTVSPWLSTSAQAQEVVQLDLPSSAPSAALLFGTDNTESSSSVAAPVRKSRSSGVLAGLYVSTVAMQALDVHSTLAALKAGGAEVNPVMAGITGNTAAFIAFKAGMTAATLMAAHHMSKTHRAAAIATLFAVNSAYAVIVSHNYRAASSRP
jgi:hypothetical protein